MHAAFDRVEPGLLGRVLDKTLLEKEAYLSLVRTADGDEYKAINFIDARVENFMLIIITRQRRPNKKLMSALMPVRVAVSG